MLIEVVNWLLRHLENVFSTTEFVKSPDMLISAL